MPDEYSFFAKSEVKLLTAYVIVLCKNEVCEAVRHLKAESFELVFCPLAVFNNSLAVAFEILLVGKRANTCAYFLDELK